MITPKETNLGGLAISLPHHTEDSVHVTTLACGTNELPRMQINEGD